MKSPEAGRAAAVPTPHRRQFGTALRNSMVTANGWMVTPRKQSMDYETARQAKLQQRQDSRVAPAATTTLAVVQSFDNVNEPQDEESNSGA